MDEEALNDPHRYLIDLAARRSPGPVERLHTTLDELQHRLHHLRGVA